MGSTQIASSPQSTLHPQVSAPTRRIKETTMGETADWALCVVGDSCMWQ